MRFSLPALTGAAALINANPEIGVESIVNASALEAILIGKIVVDATGSPTWFPRSGVSLGTGMDIHLRCDDGLIADAAPVVTLNATLADDTEGTIQSTFSVPSSAVDQALIFPVNYSLDMIPQGVGNSAKLVKEVSDVDSITNVPANTEFEVWASPAASNFVEIGFKRGAEGVYIVPATVPVANRYNPSAVIKKGRSEVPELSLEFAHISHMDGMARYNGHRTTVYLKVLKDKSVHSANIVYAGYRPQSTPKRGDGNEEVVESSKGAYERCLLFCAG